MAGRLRALSLGIALAALAATCAQAMMADIPQHIICARSSLIVIGKVTAKGDPEEMTLRAPRMKAAHKRWMREYTIRIERIIRDTKGAAPKTVTFLTPAPKPLPPVKPGQLRPIMMDGPAYANLPVGGSYLVVLDTLDAGKGYYMDAYFRNYMRADDKRVAEVVAAADVEKWPWGEAKDGLQIALVPTRTTVFAGVDRRTRKTSAFVQCCLAARNRTDKPIAINLYAEDRHMSVTADNGKGTSVAADLYRWLTGADLRAFGDWAVTTVPPKSILFIGPSGPAENGLGITLPLGPGKWSLRAAYAGKREATSAKDVPVWQGAIESKPVFIDVVEPHRP